MDIRVHNLSKSYWMDGRELVVLREVSLTIRQGEFISITGQSGAGKSTFLHVLGTLDRPTRGTIDYDGLPIFERTAAQISHFRNENVGFVFQFHHLLPEFTALENVMMPALIRRQPAKAARERGAAILQQVGLADRMEHKPGELSGGEQQRVALARALVLSPRLLLADEPTGNLDEATGGAIHDLLFRLNEELKVTAVVVTHNTSFAQRMPRRMNMAGGRITLDTGAAAHPV